MEWTEPLRPPSHPLHPVKGHLVTLRRASGGKTSLSQGCCKGQERAELAPRTPYLGSPSSARPEPGPGAARTRTCGWRDPKPARNTDLQAPPAHRAEAQSSEQRLASVGQTPGSLHSSAVPSWTSLRFILRFGQAKAFLSAQGRRVSRLQGLQRFPP